MKDFFIAFSTTTAALVGIIFAFLINKVFGFEERQEEIFDDFEKNESEIRKIEKQLVAMKQISSIENNVKNDIKNKFKDKLEKNYYELRGKEEEFINDYCRKKEIYYINNSELVKEMGNITFDFLDKEIEKMRNYFEKMDIEELSKINSCKELDNKIEFKYLNEVSNTIEFLFSFIKEEKIKEKESFFKDKKNTTEKMIKCNINSFKALDPIFPKKEQEKNNIEFEKEIKILLIEYIYKKNNIKTLLKKIRFLKKEQKKILIFLGFAYILIILGVIYPLSYVKFSNGTNLDYGLQNFFSELFTVSGFLLGALVIILSLFLCIISSGMKLKLNLNQVEERVKDLNRLESQNIILNNFNILNTKG